MTVPQPTLPEYRPTRPSPYPTWHRPVDAADSRRHRIGDTWLIGGKPRDPHDPGPWLWRTDPDFRPDTRTGRHRRGELPDSLPAQREQRTGLVNSRIGGTIRRVRAAVERGSRPHCHENC